MDQRNCARNVGGIRSRFDLHRRAKIGKVQSFTKSDIGYRIGDASRQWNARWRRSLHQEGDIEARKVKGMIEAMVLAAQRRLAAFVNRSAGQHIRAMRKGAVWHSSI